MVKKREIKPKKLTKAELEKMLLDNFVNLQKVLTNLSVKFESLSENISKLLQLFEISAKNFVEKQEGGGGGDMVSKLDTLLEQNKTIAKGLTLIEENLRPRYQFSEIGEKPKPASGY